VHLKPYERVIGISCSQLVDYCMDYLSGSLPTEDRQSFDNHLAHCPDCVNFFQTYKKTPEVSREALSLEMPERVRSEVRSFLRERYRKAP
jgi:anti-sigma factor RsiW